MLPRLVCLLLLGKLLGFDYTKFRHWIILAVLGVVIFSIAHAAIYIGRIVSNRCAVKIREWYVQFSKRSMNITTILYVTTITLPIFICLFFISGLFWSLLSWFYVLFQA